MAITAVFGLVMGTVTASGIPEAIIAAILVTVIGKGAAAPFGADEKTLRRDRYAACH